MALAKKKVAFIADSLDNAYKFQQVLSAFDVEIAAGSTMQIKKLLDQGVRNDLIIFEARGSAIASLGEVEALAEDRACPLLVIANEADLDKLQMPSFSACDFVVHGASAQECSARVRMLLRDGEVSGGANAITVTPPTNGELFSVLMKKYRETH